MGGPYLFGTKKGLHMIMHNFQADNCTNCWTGRTESLPNGTCTNLLPGCESSESVVTIAFAPWSSSGNRDPTFESWTRAPLSGDLAGPFSLTLENELGVNQTFSQREESKLLWQWSERTQEY